MMTIANSAICNIGKLLRVSPLSSHHKEKIVLSFLFII